MFHIAALSLLLSLSSVSADSSREVGTGSRISGATGNTMLQRIESTDYIANKYWEECLLLDNMGRLYANVRPSITRYLSDGQGNRQDQPVESIINDRFPLYDQESRLNLNQLLGRDGSSGEFPALRLRFVPYAEELAADDTLPVHRIGITAESWINPAPDLQVHIRARIENHGELYSQFAGRKWKEKITGWLDNAALYFYRNGVFGSVGRSYLIWGPEQHDALLISDNSPAFDRIWLGYEHRTFRFDYVIARLDDLHQGDSTLVRYFSAHRLSFRKTGVFELGLSEVALYGGYNRPMEWRYLNPFLPYYWEQFNRGGDDNMFIGVDGVIYWPKRSRIFGELMIDDFQIDFKSEPHQVGYKFGIDALEPMGITRLFAKASYTRVNTTVYGQNRPQNLYLNSGEPIGYFGGNDQDRLLALLRYHVSTSCDLELQFQYNRRGEGRIERHPSGAVSKEVKFPSGIVEKSPSLQLTAELFHSQLWQGRAAFSYSRFANYQHVRGRNHDRIGLELKISYYLQGSFD
jgi:hypothetical protein